jgi:hypothetical protein
MEKQDNSYPTKSLFAFCGSALIAKQLKEAKVLSDLVLSMTGNTTNGTDLVAETKLTHMDPIQLLHLVARTLSTSLLRIRLPLFQVSNKNPIPLMLARLSPAGKHLHFLLDLLGPVY